MTRTVTPLVPAVFGVPLMTPAAEIVSPAGRPVAENVYGVAPPLAVTVVVVYAAPT